MRKFEQRRRNKNDRPKKSFVIIGCEGRNQTEKNYFKNFHSKECIIKFAKGNSTDPKGIVQDIVNYINSEIEIDENDKIYVVFDTDVGQNKQQQIEDAKRLEKYQLNEGQALDSESCNPYTGVYKVTDELINRNKVK